jgi:hypothetical protein
MFGNVRTSSACLSALNASIVKCTDWVRSYPQGKVSHAALHADYETFARNKLICCLLICFVDCSANTESTCICRKAILDTNGDRKQPLESVTT